MIFESDGIPNSLEAKPGEVPIVGRRKVSHPVATERAGQAGVDNMPEPRCCRCGPFPKRLSDERFCIGGNNHGSRLPFDHIRLRTHKRWVVQKIAATIEGRKLPVVRTLCTIGKTVNEMFGRLPHDFRQGPVLRFRDLFEPPVERVGELNLSANHVVNRTSTLH